jgi:hypothetical protein
MQLASVAAMVANRAPDERITIQLPDPSSNRQHRELGAFARYCIQRLEKDIGSKGTWVVTIRASQRGFASHVKVRHYDSVLEETSAGQDGALATWYAMCRLEQRLRERSALPWG